MFSLQRRSSWLSCYVIRNGSTAVRRRERLRVAVGCRPPTVISEIACSVELALSKKLFENIWLRTIAELCAYCTALLAASTAAAQYPSKLIRLIVPSAPGGSPAIYARLIASELGKQMGQQVVVDNRPGGNGIVGLEAITRAPADGYTMGNATFPFILQPSVYAKTAL
jgi:Tripartite tricarboxylate transporter family receptor